VGVHNLPGWSMRGPDETELVVGCKPSETQIACGLADELVERKTDGTYDDENSLRSQEVTNKICAEMPTLLGLHELSPIEQCHARLT
jgi:hypothetical protein